MRKLLAVLGAVALAAVLIPSSADADPGDNQGVVIFTGDAFTGNVPGNWTNAPGVGLCLPGLDPATGCGPGGSLTPGENGWRFNVPAQNVATPAGDLEGSCNAYGIFDGTVVTTDDIPLVDPGNCDIVFDGSTTAILGGTGPIGPVCGAGAGSSSSTLDADNDGVSDDDDPDNGEGPDTFEVGTVSGEGNTAWITSAGSLLPISGQVFFPGSTYEYVGLVQANAIPQSADGIPCVNEPAVRFTVLGVTAGAGT